MNRELRLAYGLQGLVLAVPEAVTVAVPRPLQDSPPAPSPSPADLLRTALHNPAAGPTLAELATGRRRAVVLVGDLSFPAPYPLLLPALCAELVALGIRPTRISFLCCPGASGPVLGRQAVRCYGAETVGEHELRAWTWNEAGPEERDSLFEAADLKLAVLPTLPDARSAFPMGIQPDIAVAVTPSRGLVSAVTAVRAGPPELVFQTPNRASGAAESASSWQVYLSSGGGDPTDATLEDALAGLRPGTLAANAPAHATRVLAFAGAEGLGSARFTLDLWWLLDWLAKEQPSDAALPQEPPFLGPWNALQALADIWNRNGRVILFSPGLAEHHEGDELSTRVAESPQLAKRLLLTGAQDVLWTKLESLHGGGYSLLAEPLGWRGVCS